MTDQPQNPSGEAKPPGLTAGQLRKALEGVSDDMTVTVRTEDMAGDCFCGGILSASIENAHDEDNAPQFAIDCSDDEEAFDE